MRKLNGGWIPVSYELELIVDAENDIWDCFEVEFNWLPEIPAVIFAAPENCHPAEGDEIEIIKITLAGQKSTDCTDDFDHDLIEEELWQSQNMWEPEPDFGDC